MGIPTFWKFYDKLMREISKHRKKHYLGDCYIKKQVSISFLNKKCFEHFFLCSFCLCLIIFIIIISLLKCLFTPPFVDTESTRKNVFICENHYSSFWDCVL